MSTFAEIVAFLSRPEAYGPSPAAVEIRETHRSVVFLTTLAAYKLKKRERDDGRDFSLLSARHRNAVNEVRLNRRFSSGVYERAVPVTLAEGRLSVDGRGRVVDWLVQMKRLPAGEMLDALIAGHRVTADHLRRTTAHLAACSRRCPGGSLSPEWYIDRLLGEIEGNLGVLTQPCATRLGNRQKAAIRASAGRLAERVRHGKVIEGHGDLRPEHVCLANHVQVIDCIEFDRGLRTLDVVDDFGLLELECERLGVAGSPDLWEIYRQETGDGEGVALKDLYQSVRAAVRARLAWLRYRKAPGDARWAERAEQYLRLAEARLGA